MNTQVSDEIASLLQQKGMSLLALPKTMIIKGTNGILKTDSPALIKTNPTIVEVVMWIYKKHNIWISVSIRKWNYAHNTFRFDYNISKVNHNEYNHDTPVEAYTKAILYILNNLI